jgi:hypothetical protein
MTVNGKSTCDIAALAGTGLARRGLGAAVHPDINVNTPPYAYMPFPLRLEHGYSCSVVTGSITVRLTCRPTRSQRTRRTMVALSSSTRTIFSAQWRSSRRTPRCAPCSPASVRSSSAARHSQAWASTPGTGCARHTSDGAGRVLIRAAARRQLLEVGVHALHDSGCPPVPDVPDPDGRRGHVSRRASERATSGSSRGEGAVQPVDAGGRVHAVLQVCLRPGQGCKETHHGIQVA